MLKYANILPFLGHAHTHTHFAVRNAAIKHFKPAAVVGIYFYFCCHLSWPAFWPFRKSFFFLPSRVFLGFLLFWGFSFFGVSFFLFFLETYASNLIKLYNYRARQARWEDEKTTVTLTNSSTQNAAPHYGHGFWCRG